MGNDDSAAELVVVLHWAMDESGTVVAAILNERQARRRCLGKELKVSRMAIASASVAKSRRHRVIECAAGDAVETQQREER